jgi:hypothetical protein
MRNRICPSRTTVHSMVAASQWILSILLAMLLPVCLVAQSDPAKQQTQSPSEIDLLSKDTAIQATQLLRNECVDPTSFTLLEAFASTRLDKDPRRPRIFAGCIHFVASNRLGARMQSCGGYYTDKKGKLQVFGGSPQNTGEPCTCAGKGIDVTAEAKDSLSKQ